MDVQRNYATPAYASYHHIGPLRATQAWLRTYSVLVNHQLTQYSCTLLSLSSNRPAGLYKYL